LPKIMPIAPGRDREQARHDHLASAPSVEIATQRA
jgi:hypothetical protein